MPISVYYYAVSSTSSLTWMNLISLSTLPNMANSFPEGMHATSPNWFEPPIGSQL